jgi:hypothetical protein
VVQPLFEQLLLRSAMLDRLRGDRTLDAEVRQKALVLADDFTEDADALNNLSWRTARRSGLPAEQYAQALRYAQEACLLQPKRTDFAYTLGVAQYRACQYGQALATLQRSAPNLSARRNHCRFNDLVFLAMTQFRLGQAARTEMRPEQVDSASRTSRGTGSPAGRAPTLSITNNSQGEEDKGFARTLCGATAGGTESGTPLFSGDFRHPLLRSLKLLVIDRRRPGSTVAPPSPPAIGAAVRPPRPPAENVATAQPPRPTPPALGGCPPAAARQE